MADTIFTGQTPVSTSFDLITHSLGMEFTVSANSAVTGGRAWVTSGGRPVTFFWQLWRVSDQAMLAECNLNLLPPPGVGWMSFTSADFVVPGDVPIVTTESYVVNVFTDDGNFVFTDDGSETFPIGTGIVSSNQGRFRNGGIQTDFPNGTGVTYFFADVNVSTNDVTAILDLTFPAAQFAFTGTAQPPAISIFLPLAFYVPVTGVSACIVEELQQGFSDGLPTLGVPGRVVPLVPGNEVPWDGCECGQLAQVIEHGPYPSNFAFPDEDTGIFGNCRLDGRAVRVRASLTRCEYHPCPDEQGHPPSAAAQLAAAQMQQVDEYLMRNAISCCLAGMRSDRLIDDYALGGSDYQVNGCCGEVSMVYWLQMV